MEYIIHLTEKCNLNCTYCYEKKMNKNIQFEHITDLVDYEISNKSKKTLIYFYGGEPLLQKSMIKNTIDYINSKKSKTKFNFGITTNGLFLDEEFLKYMKRNNFSSVAYSIDGIKEAHDLNRVTIDGKGTFDIVEKNSKILLKYFDSSIAMPVVTKNNLKYLDKNVEYLIDIGFKIINLQFDYLQDWQEEDLNEIREQYQKVANIYSEKIMQEYDIEIPLIDNKIKSYVDDKYDCNNECKLGMLSVNVGTDGNFYPCMQFVNNEKFIIGNCKTGIDENARANLMKNSKIEEKVCKECVIRKRCKHTCPCKNYVLCEDINKLSPIICETEKIFVEIADKMAEYLYNQHSKMFMQKYYNKNYYILKEFVKRG